MTAPTRIGDFVEILSGFAFDSEYFGDSGTLPVVRIRDVVRGKSSTYYSGTFDNKYVIKDGDMLIGMDGEFNRARWRGGEALLNQRVCRISSSSSILDDKYLFHMLPRALSEIERSTPFVTVKHLSVKQIREIAVPLPSVTQQRRIAEILDKAEALRIKRRAALDQLDALCEASFTDMFGDDHTIMDRWPVNRLERLLTFLTSGSRGWAEHYADKGDLFLRIQNVRRDELALDDIAYVKTPQTAEARRTRVAAGDVLLSITADLGRTAVVPSDLPSAFINQHLAILRLTNIEPRFVSAFLASAAGKRQLQTRNRQGVKAGLNFDDIRSFLIPSPPPQLQRAFANAAAAVDALRKLSRKAEQTASSLFASLQHRAFRGEL